MRLARLDLIRYGRFLDAAIAFPKPGPDRPDVTLVYGPNEAGKSTSFNALLELLFGFKPGPHPYDFRFARSDLLVGAELELPGRGTLTLRRSSKRSGSLLDAQNRPVAEAILAGALHGLSREAFEERFSLDETGLRVGGARIAGAQGDLGQLLHAGLSGLTGMAQALEALTARADAFHKKHGRATVLKTGSDRLKQISRDLREAQLTPERERKLRGARSRAAEGFETADAALKRCTQRQAASAAAALWERHDGQIARLGARLEALPGGSTLPPGTAEQVARLLEKIAGAGARIAEAEADIAAQDQLLAAHPADPLAGALAAELDRLDGTMIDGAPLMGRASTARADLDKRRDALAGIARAMDAAAVQIAPPDVPAAALVLEAEALEALAAAVQDAERAETAAKAAQQALGSARAQQGSAPAKPTDLTSLCAAHAHWTSVADLAAAEAAQAQARARLTTAEAGLPEHWRACVAAGLPARESLDAARRDWARTQADLDAARSDLDARAADLAQAQAATSALAAEPEATTDAAATEATRRRRDMLWQQHKDSGSPDSAVRFEAAMHADDTARAHYLAGAETRQALRAAALTLSTAQARHAGAQAKHADLDARMAALSQHAAHLASALGLEAGTTPEAFGARHQALSLAAEAAADLANAEAALDAHKARRGTALAALRQAAGAAGLDAASDDLPAEVQRALALEQSTRTAWQGWQERARHVAALTEAAAQAQHAQEAARARLAQAAAGLALPDTAPGALGKALPHLRRLHMLAGEHGGLTERIEALEQAIGTLGQGAQRLAHLAQTPQDADPLAIIDAARARSTQARQADEKRSAAQEQRGKAEHRRRSAQADAAAATAALETCFARQGGEDLAPQARIAALTERDRLRAERDAAEQERQAARSGVDADLFAEELAGMPSAARAAELEQALEDARTARDAARDAMREAERLYGAAFDAASTDALATEQATLLEELQGGAREAAVARLAVLTARGALRRLAAERRSDMVRDVEAAFVAMTAPAWSGVDVWSAAEGEKLVGVKPDGGTVPVEQMSTGTMGQLYFALRLAGYRSFAREAGPLPMVLDDIMETFDDTRARAALTLCAQIGTQGQAILFTHHAHLVELARGSIPGVAVVDMPA